MKLTAGLRVKDGEPWAEDCLSSLSAFVDDICVLDDGSTDATPRICRSFPKVRHLVRWEKSFFHEGIDRNVVLALVKDTEPDWILMMDIDELFEDRIAGGIQSMMQVPEVVAWGFLMLHFWDGKTHFRIDGPWGHETRHHVHPRLFRNQPGLHYPTQTIHGAHVLGLTGGEMALSDVLIKHYGYSFADKTREKYERYRAVDPDGNYEHLLANDGAVFVEYSEHMGLQALMGLVQ
jgi:hypothetical protein